MINCLSVFMPLKCLFHFNSKSLVIFYINFNNMLLKHLIFFNPSTLSLYTHVQENRLCLLSQ